MVGDELPILVDYFISVIHAIIVIVHAVYSSSSWCSHCLFSCIAATIVVPCSLTDSLSCRVVGLRDDRAGDLIL